MQYTWKVLSTDAVNGTMLVSYTASESTHTFNMRMPPAGVDPAEYINAAAPSHLFREQEYAEVQAGMSGSGVVLPPEEPPSETPKVNGSWNEEYLRAMIYQVMEEIREAEA